MSKMLKKLFGFLFLFTSGILFSAMSSVSFAQPISYELYRTDSTPGFFELRVFPGEELSPLSVQNVFVKNFSIKNKEKFAVLLDYLKKNELKTITPDQVLIEERNRKITPRETTNRYIYLGNSAKYTDIVFKPREDQTDIIKAFNIFLSQQLEPVLLRNIRISTGGNVSDVYPSKIDYIGKNAGSFFGKFRKGMKTRVRIYAEVSGENFSAEVPLYFSEEGVVLDEGDSSRLGDLWEKQNLFRPYKEILSTKAPIHDERWLQYFPYMLGAIGFIFLFIAILPLFARVSGRTKVTNATKKFRKKILNIPPAPKFWDHYPTQRSYEASEDEEFWESGK